jgi:hypothetical protein
MDFKQATEEFSAWHDEHASSASLSPDATARQYLFYLMRIHAITNHQQVAWQSPMTDFIQACNQPQVAHPG